MNLIHTKVKSTKQRPPKIFLAIHPLDEPSYRRKTSGKVTVPWNTSTGHRRKFIGRKGQYLSSNVPAEAKLYFWGEYEPETEATIISRYRPRAVHDVLKPVRGMSPIPSGAQNTDPYVFGEHFKNVCCWTGRRRYVPGDMIMFGAVRRYDSKRKVAYFVLDTVIIVKDKPSVNHALNTTQFYKACIEPLGGRKEYFYRGKNFKPGSKYYSYVPCLLDYSKLVALKSRDPLDTAPIIDLTAMGFTVKWHGRYWSAGSIPFTHARWQYVQDEIIRQGWNIGVHINKI